MEKFGIDAYHSEPDFLTSFSRLNGAAKNLYAVYSYALIFVPNGHKHDIADRDFTLLDRAKDYGTFRRIVEDVGNSHAEAFGGRWHSYFDPHDTYGVKPFKSPQRRKLLDGSHPSATA